MGSHKHDKKSPHTFSKILLDAIITIVCGILANVIGELITRLIK